MRTLRHPDGAPCYGNRGRLYRTRTGGATGPVLCERTDTPTVESCRALLASSITGQFEAWHEGESFARMTGVIEDAAKLDVKEGPVRFVRYEPAPIAERLPQARSNSPPVSDSHTAGRGGSDGAIARLHDGSGRPYE